MAQKIGSRSRQVLYLEDTPGQDPGSPKGYVVPLHAESTVVPTQDPIEAPVFMGARRPFGTVPGLINVNGDNPVGMEFRFLGVLLRLMTAGAEQPPGMGGGFLHYFPWAPSSTDQPTCQLQDEFPGGGSTAYLRKKLCMWNNMRLAYAVAGPAQFACNVMGSGDTATTDLAGDVTDFGYAGASYYNGYAKKDSTLLASVTAFDMTIGNDVQRQDVAFNEGIAGNIYPGIPLLNGTLALMFEDMDYYNQGVLNDPLLLECLWGNKGLSTLTQFLLISMPQTRFFRRGVAAGSKMGKTIQQRFNAEVPDVTDTGANAAAAFIFSGIGPFNIDGTNDSLVITVAPNAPQTITLTHGSARTADEIVTELNGTPITGATADVWPKTAKGVGSRVRITSSIKGVDSTITTDGASASGALGFTTDLAVGHGPAHAHIYLFNDQDQSYAP